MPGGGEITIAAPMQNGIHSGVVIQNNILHTEGNGPVMVLGTNVGITLGHNLFSKTPPATCHGKGDVIGNPKLAGTDTYKNPSRYEVLSDSFPIDHAVVLAKGMDDYWKNPRGVSPDIGGHDMSVINHLPPLLPSPPNPGIPTKMG